MKLKSSNKCSYAMKSIKIRSKFHTISDEHRFVSSLINEREIGLIGRECRFLSGLIASFKSKVSLKKVLLIENISLIILNNI